MLRAGLSSDVLALAEEAVMSCAICRKHVRLPGRPQVKIGANAGNFNDRVHMDLFQFKQTWILLLVELLARMHEHWFTVFGPPSQLVMDQETSLVSEMERFNIARVLKGTTRQRGKAVHGDRTCQASASRRSP